MISVYDIGNSQFGANGDAVLMPTECKHTQIAGGQYDLTMTHPVDPAGKWTHLVPEAIIKAPVPEETIESAVSGLEADVYATTTTAEMREGPNEPSVINYTAWSAGTSYAVGAKVTYSSKNYKLTELLSGYEIYSTPDTLSKWKEIARMTSGDPVVMKLKTGMEVYDLEDPDCPSGWKKVTTIYGVEGYIKTTVLEYVRHATAAETAPRTIRDQLFRIRNVTVDTKGMTVSVTAEHVSYDLNGVLIEKVSVKNKSCAFAMGMIEAAMMMDYAGTFATNITDAEDGTITVDINGKSATYGILDPDKGLVKNFDAAYRRDNWDLFVMKKTDTDRGFRLRYRKNMIGVNWTIKTDQLITRVVPVAKDEKGEDFFLDPVKWVDSTHISEYPVIRMEWLKVAGQVGKDDGTESATNWTETTLRAEMQTKAEERFSKDKIDVPVHELTVDFLMIGSTAEYPDLRHLEEVLMYDKVIVTDERIGLQAEVNVSEIEFDCIKERITALKLTNVINYGGKNVSGFNVVNNSITGDKLTEEAAEGIRNAAADQANDYTDSVDTRLRAWAMASFEPRT